MGLPRCCVERASRKRGNTGQLLPSSTRAEDDDLAGHLSAPFAHSNGAASLQAAGLISLGDQDAEFHGPEAAERRLTRSAWYRYTSFITRPWISVVRLQYSVRALLHADTGRGCCYFGRFLTVHSASRSAASMPLRWFVAVWQAFILGSDHHQQHAIIPSRLPFAQNI